MPTDVQRIEAVFLAAAEIAAAADRARFLDGACDGDAELRCRVEALLRAHDQPDSLLDHPVVAPDDPDLGATQALSGTPNRGVAAGQTTGSENGASDDEPLTFLTPSARPDSLGRLGHYEVLQVLGRGGFGIVFRAFDEMLQRVVALKVMAPQLAATSPARKRFLREARSSAQVRHENVVQVYEVAEQPLPYLAMEFIPGETLQQWLDRVGPLDVPQVLRIGRQIAEGLAAAHATDLIHRDIKPANVLIEGGQHKVKITDFGLARAADDASISQSGIIAGTPMYMAPEQAKGETLDQRADLFGLGSVLYQMVAGRPPFRASTAVAVLKRVAEDQPRAIREIIPETPQWLCDIIAKLHAKDPDDRYQSAREVADVLADCEAQLKANARLKDYSRIPRSKPQRSERRKWVAVAAAVFFPLIALTATELTGVTHLFHKQPGVVPSPHSAPSPNDSDSEGWVQLFNHKDLTGWRPHPTLPGNWRVEKGILVGSGPSKISYLVSQRNDYQHFHLRAEVRVHSPEDGSGIFFRAGLDTQDFAGTQVLSPPFHEVSIFMDQYRVWPPPGSVLLDGRKWVLAVDFLPKANEWFTLEIIAEGPSIMTKVNGHVVVPGSTWARTALKPGYILLQQYGPETRVEFRKIEIKELPRVQSDTPRPEAKSPPLAVAPFTNADVQRIAALPAVEQIEEVRKELKRRNPGFDGKMETRIEGGVVTEFRIVTDKVTDIAPIRVFNSLRVLDLGGTHTNYHPNGQLADLSPLKGMNLTELTKLNLNLTKVGDVGLVHFKDCTNLTYLGLGATRVSDNGLAYYKNCKSLTSLELFYIPASDAGLAYFKDCKGLTRLNLVGTKVSDSGLANFKDCKNLTTLSLDRTQVGDAGMVHFQDCKSLTDLGLAETKVSDVGLAHFKDCKKLIYLSLTLTQVGDAGLAQLKGMPLRVLWIYNTGITDLTPLQGMPLEKIYLTPKNITRGLDILRDMKSLKTIGIREQAWSAAEFWERYGKGEFKE